MKQIFNSLEIASAGREQKEQAFRELFKDLVTFDLNMTPAANSDWCIQDSFQSHWNKGSI